MSKKEVDGAASEIKMSAVHRTDVKGVEDQYLISIEAPGEEPYQQNHRISSLLKEKAHMEEIIAAGEGGPRQESAERMLASIDNRLAAIEAAG